MQIHQIKLPQSPRHGPPQRRFENKGRAAASAKYFAARCAGDCCQPGICNGRPSNVRGNGQKQPKTVRARISKNVATPGRTAATWPRCIIQRLRARRAPGASKSRTGHTCAGVHRAGASETLIERFAFFKRTSARAGVRAKLFGPVVR